MKYIKEAVGIFFKKENLVYFLKIYSIAFFLEIASFVYSYILKNLGYSSQQWLFFIPSFILFPIGLWAQASGYEAAKRVVLGGVLEFKSTYKSSWKYLWRFFLVSLLVGLIVVGGLVLLIIPAVIFGVWFAFSLWGVVEKGFGALQSMKESKKLVAGKFWPTLGSLLIFILFALVAQIALSLVTYGIGSLLVTLFGELFLLPYYLLYQELQAAGKK